MTILISIFWFIICCDCLLSLCSFLYYRPSFYFTRTTAKIANKAYTSTRGQGSLADFVDSNALKYKIILNTSERFYMEMLFRFLKCFSQIIVDLASEQRVGAYTVIPCKHSKLLDWQFHIKRLILKRYLCIPLCLFP